MDPAVDTIIERSETWSAEMAALRRVLLATGLTEEVKWRQPCYTHDGANIVIMGEMKRALTLGFFKGELLDDPDGVMADNGPNSRSARRVHFTSVDDVERLAAAVTRLVADAVAVEEAGLTVGPAPEPDLCAELVVRLDADPELRAGFESLTPGRRREYDIYFSGAKKPETRAARVEKFADRIRAGRGMRDR